MKILKIKLKEMMYDMGPFIKIKEYQTSLEDTSKRKIKQLKEFQECVIGNSRIIFKKCTIYKSITETWKTFKTFIQSKQEKIE